MSSGVGVVFVVVVGIDLLLDRRRRILSPLLGIPIAIYVTWYALIGRAGVGTFASIRDPFSIAAWIDAPGAIVAGAGNAVGAVVGVGPTIGVWVGILGLGLVAFWFLTNPFGPGTGRFLACLAGIATQYALIGIFRGDLVADVTNYTRYTYVSAILLIVGASALLPRLRFSDPVLRRRIVLVGGGSLLVVSLSWNARLLIEGQAVFQARAEMTRALVAAGLTRPLPAGVDPNRSLVLVPAPASLERIVAQHGSPLGDSLVPSAVTPPRPAVAAEATQRLIEGAPIFLPQE